MRAKDSAFIAARAANKQRKNEFKMIIVDYFVRRFACIPSQQDACRRTGMRTARKKSFDLTMLLRKRDFISVKKLR